LKGDERLELVRTFVSTAAFLVETLHILFSEAKEPSGSSCVHAITSLVHIFWGQLLKFIESKISLCLQQNGPLKVILMVSALRWVIIHTLEPIGKQWVISRIEIGCIIGTGNNGE
jgi:hypothetical protein